jgi:hypothetical protein
LRQISAGTESLVPGRGNDGDTNIRVIFDFLKSLKQAHGNFRVNGVSCLGAVNRNCRNMVFHFVVDGFHLYLLYFRLIGFVAPAIFLRRGILLVMKNLIHWVIGDNFARSSFLAIFSSVERGKESTMWTSCTTLKSASCSLQ